MKRRKTRATRPSVPNAPALGLRARFVAMMGVLQCLVAAPTLRARRWPRRTMRLVHVFVVAMRLVVAMTAVQITGIPHVVADVAAIAQGSNHAEDCPNDEDGRECPPGCPSCHCTHAMNALPSVAPPTLLDLLAPIEVAIALYDPAEPSGPDPAALYRPPRPGRVSS
ncbi:MAG: hypothetical protein IPM54_45330 [Polyangiaceae bacterium]|nr:hypothetical protein [Polyangiaceae bacterium]